MILSVHILFGAAVGNAMGNAALGVPLAFASHYMLDALPHREYDIDRVENVARVGIRAALFDFAKVFIDFFGGLIALILIAPPETVLPWLLVFGFIACVPDGISFLNFALPNNRILKRQLRFHKYIHIHPNKSDTPWRIGIPFQIAAVLAAIVLLY